MKEIDASKNSFVINQVNESDRLRLARQILLFLLLLCAAVFTAYFLQPDNKAIINIFELVKIGVFLLVTLVISFYFPNMPGK